MINVDRRTIIHCEQEMDKMRMSLEEFMDEVAPLKNVGLQVKAIALKLSQMEEKMENSTTQTDVND